MKTKVPNQFINQLNVSLMFLIPKIIMRQFILFFMLVFCFTSMEAQSLQVSKSQKVLEVKSFINSLKSSELSSRTANSKSARLEHLLKDLQPAIYISAKNVKKYGAQPNSIYVDLNALGSISSSNIEIADVEIVTIKINSISELNKKIDLSVFSKFKNLKYVYIVSSIETDADSIINSIQNSNSNYSVFYKIDKGA